MNFKTLTMTLPQRDTILAALRLWQSMLKTGEPIPADILALAEDPPLTDDDIEVLIGKLG